MCNNYESNQGSSLPAPCMCPIGCCCCTWFMVWPCKACGFIGTCPAVAKTQKQSNGIKIRFVTRMECNRNVRNLLITLDEIGNEWFVVSNVLWGFGWFVIWLTESKLIGISLDTIWNLCWDCGGWFCVGCYKIEIFQLQKANISSEKQINRHRFYHCLFLSHLRNWIFAALHRSDIWIFHIGITIWIAI